MLDWPEEVEAVNRALRSAMERQVAMPQNTLSALGPLAGGSIERESTPKQPPVPKNPRAEWAIFRCKVSALAIALSCLQKNSLRAKSREADPRPLNI